jgi:hypothetical protein
MPPRCNQKPIVHLHHLIRHTLTEPRAPTIPEKKCRRQTKFDPSKMQTNANTRAATEWHVRDFLLRRQRYLAHEADPVETTGLLDPLKEDESWR